MLTTEERAITGRDNDTQCETRTIRSVEGDREKGWSVGFVEGFSFWVPKDSPIVPCIGQTAILYGKGIGYIVRGLVLDGVEVFYRTPTEEDARWQQECDEREQQRRDEYAANKDANDARIAALPAEFKDRIHRFRRVNPDFGWQHEGYELFTCEQAVLIAQTLKSGAAIDEFRALPWEQQKERVEISDDHSGNTFGAACALARIWLDQPQHVAHMHGALCPLVGCDDYGCFAATQDATLRT